MMPARLSIIIPFYNEEENIDRVIGEVRTTLPEAEIIAVNDGSTDATARMLDRLAADALHAGRIVPIHFPANHGKGHALYHGLQKASCEACILLDGDGQFDPADIARLAAGLEETHLVVGFRADRKDTLLTRAVSRVANAVRRLIFRDPVRDVGGLKALRRSAALEHLFPFEGLHRYIPSLFAVRGLAIAEMPVHHRPRAAGTSKYSHLYRLRRAFVEIPLVYSAIRGQKRARKL